MGQENERPGLQYRQHAQGLAQAVERQQAASRDAIHWQDVMLGAISREWSSSPRSRHCITT